MRNCLKSGWLFPHHVTSLGQFISFFRLLLRTGSDLRVAFIDINGGCILAIWNGHASIYSNV